MSNYFENSYRISAENSLRFAFYDLRDLLRNAPSDVERIDAANARDLADKLAEIVAEVREAADELEYLENVAANDEREAMERGAALASEYDRLDVFAVAAK